jgi:murein DD-endopeptidase MepM/ murein hydrolase activator NlpD
MSNESVSKTQPSGNIFCLPVSIFGGTSPSDQETKLKQETKPVSGQPSKPNTTPVKSSSSANSSELKRGDFDDVACKKYSSKTSNKPGYVAGKKIEQLQKDLITVGIPDIGSADGDFGPKTETGVKKFQEYALKRGRRTVSGSLEVDVTFKGSADGIAAQATLDELELWLFNGHLIPQNLPNTNSASGSGNSDFIFPLAVRPLVAYKDGGRNFGASRDGGRKHAGCDLIAPKGSPIYAIGDGEVIQAEYDFYEGTNALEVKHGSYVVRYGEILPKSASGLAAGSKVSKGQLIAKVGLLNSGSSMLHFEMYSGIKTGGLTNRANHPYQRRSDLINPTTILDNMQLKQ